MTTVATWNLGDGADQTKARGLDRLVHHGADIICLQEAGDRGRLLNRWCEMTGWHAWLGEGPGASSVPILWNPKAVRSRVTGTTPATPATNAGRLGAGPAVVKAKVWNRVRFGTDDGALVVINGHLPASLYLPKRRALARRQVDVLEQMVAKRKGHVPVVATMDGNAKASDRLWRPLRALGMEQHTTRPTHGRRTIDLIWSLGITANSAQVIDMPSDHRAALIHIKEHR